MDVITDPTIYTDDRINKITTQKFCMAFLVDTETDTIVAARVLCLGDNIYKKLSQSLNKMVELGITTEDMISAFWEYINPKNLDECLKRAMIHRKRPPQLYTKHNNNCIEKLLCHFWQSSQITKLFPFAVILQSIHH